MPSIHLMLMTVNEINMMQSSLHKLKVSADRVLFVRHGFRTTLSFDFQPGIKLDLHNVARRAYHNMTLIIVKHD